MSRSLASISIPGAPSAVQPEHPNKVVPSFRRYEVSMLHLMR
ncbi:hypothetical protein [Lysobacter gummosus]